MAGRWDHLFDAKPVPLLEHLLQEVSKLLAKDLARWPPPLQEVEPGSVAAQLLAEPGPRPAPRVYREAFRLARWDLAREFDAYDDYMRNERWRAAGLAPAERPVVLFLSQWLVEQMLGLAEATEGRVKRPQLQQCLDLTEQRVAAGPVLLA